MEHALQKASLGKRIAAGILDGILICILATGFAFLLSVLLGYDGYYQTLTDGYSRYETQYGVSFDIPREELSDADREKWDAAYKALSQDEEVIQAYNVVLNLTLVIASVAILLSVLAWEFAVPLLLHNGQTVGKKVFSLGLVRVDGVQVTNLQLMVRALLGKFTVEIMIPVFVILMVFWGISGLIGPIVLLALLVAQAICLCVSKTNALLHDQMAGTAVVDISSQRIFRSTEDLIAYQKQVAAERAARQTY
jgi:uncharacterized RDD family membrane protein YckC